MYCHVLVITESSFSKDVEVPLSEVELRILSVLFVLLDRALPRRGERGLAGIISASSLRAVPIEMRLLLLGLVCGNFLSDEGAGA